MNEFDEVAEEFDAWTEEQREIYIKGIYFGMNYIAGFNHVAKLHERLTLATVNKLMDDWAEMEFANFKDLIEKLSLYTIVAVKGKENVN